MNEYIQKKHIYIRTMIHIYTYNIHLHTHKHTVTHKYTYNIHSYTVTHILYTHCDTHTHKHVHMVTHSGVGGTAGQAYPASSDVNMLELLLPFAVET